jgi:predicted DCC family thiol-disulfide oxidoreductase YuxK
VSDQAEPLWIVYDGACPFCAAYVRMVRLRKAAGDVRLIDAREGGPIVMEALSRGFDLDEGMAMKIGGRFYHGDEVMHMVAMMSGESDLFNRVHAWIFRSPTRARLLYPALRSGRNLALRLLGHQRLADLGLAPPSKTEG